MRFPCFTGTDGLMRLAALVLAMVAVDAQAFDRSMRCSRQLIYAGGGKDSAGMYEVLKACGEPVAQQGDTWIYVQGSMRRILVFNTQGRLQTIESRRN